MNNVTKWVVIAVVGLGVIGLVGWMAFNGSSGGHTKVENTAPPSADAAMAPLPGQAQTAAPGQAQPAMDAQGAAVIR